MSLKGRKVGVAFTGSFCTYKKVFDELQKLADEGAEIQTIFSDAAKSIDSRFGNAEDFVAKARSITGKEPMLTIPQAERSVLRACWIFLLSCPAQAIP